MGERRTALLLSVLIFSLLGFIALAAKADLLAIFLFVSALITFLVRVAFRIKEASNRMSDESFQRWQAERYPDTDKDES